MTSTDTSRLPWASPPINGQALRSLHEAESRFAVTLLSTPRSALICCQPDDKAAEAKSRAQPGDFDFLPVEKNGEIVGLFSRKQDYAEESVSDVMRLLNESILMATDACMLDFLETADTRRFVFLVENNGISGAVTLSDIQKIEARPAIFLRLTTFEILLNDWIRQNAHEEWLGHVNSRERQQIQRWFDQRHEAGEEVDRVAVSSITPKLKACKALGVFDAFPDAAETLDAFVQLRDQLAHAQDFAHCESLASQIPRRIRQLKDYITHLEALCFPGGIND